MARKENTALLTEHVRGHLVELYDSMGLCGCGSPGDAWSVLRAVLLALRHRAGYDGLRAAVGSDGGAMFVVTALDGAGLTEHGTSYGFSWLLPKGDWVLDRLLELGDDVDIAELLDAEGLPPGEPCTCKWKEKTGGG